MPSDSSRSLCQVKLRLERACQRLLDLDAELFRFDVNERTITQRLSLYLQSEFPDYAVDCEYNRNMDETKRLPVPVTTIQSNDIKGVTVFPDIVVHRRGSHESNLLALEAKKNAPDGAVAEHDAKKLCGFTTQTAGDFGYSWGVFVNFRITGGVCAPAFTWFAGGRQLLDTEVDELSRSDEVRDGA
jgi:hypothetical protein